MILWKLLVLLNVLENFFSTYLDWVFFWFLNLDLDSWHLEPWILILDWFLNLDLDSWHLEPWILILDFRLSSWVLNSSWFLSWTLELFLIDLWAFCHHLCRHLLLSSLLSSKHLWITFDSPWSFASTISPFLMMTTSEIKKHTHTFS